MEELIGRLKQRLQYPLPGRIAHQEMAPDISAQSRVKFKFSGQLRKGAVLILLYEVGGQVRFPLIQRPVYEGVHSGQIALPGGRHEDRDTDLIATAIREAQEEVGINPDTVEVIGQLTDFLVAVSNHLVLPVVAFTSVPPTFVPDPYEVNEVIEARLEDLLDNQNVKETEMVTSGGYRLQSPYYDMNGKVVWGATAMILSELVHLIREL